MTTRERWLELVKINVRGTVDEQQKIADICYDEQNKGNERINVWHAVHLYSGKPCHCRACNPKR